MVRLERGKPGLEQGSIQISQFRFLSSDFSVKFRFLSEVQVDCFVAPKLELAFHHFRLRFGPCDFDTAQNEFLCIGAIILIGSQCDTLPRRNGRTNNSSQ